MKKLCRRFLCSVLFLLLALNGILPSAVSALEAQPDQETENLEKLCLVWGYVKYTHPSCLSGSRDWDKDLMELIEPVSEAETDEAVNALLHEYVLSLGPFDYGTDFIDATWSGLEENQKVFLAKTDWRSDAEYLGAELSAALMQLNEIPTIYRGNAPVFSSPSSPDGITVRFDNEPVYENIDYAASEGDIRKVMDEFAAADGLIIDLRQPSAVTLHEVLGEYLVGTRQAFALWRYPSWTVPGAYAQYDLDYIGGGGLKYDRPVVLLIDERTQSHGEYTAMAISKGENVTLMGSDTVGSDGNVTLIAMPDGNFFQFTGWGVLTADGKQTQRLGISPDIHVSCTIQGISEGRDELLEAAVRYLINQ